MSIEDIKQAFEAKAIDKYGSVYAMSKKTGLHYNIFMRYRNKPGDVKLSTLIKLMDLLDLKIEVALK